MRPRAPERNVLSVVSPFDGSELAELPLTDWREIDKQLHNAERMFRQRRSWLPLAERIGVLERAARIMGRQHGELARLASSEGGKPLVDSQVEVRRAIETVRECAQWLRSDAGVVVPMGMTSASRHRLAFTQHEPIGVVVAVSAFNHPLNLIAHQVAPAVAAGCPVIVKPAATTPLSCLRFVEILHEAGLPEYWVQAAVIEDNEVAEALVTDSRVGFFSFVGSAPVGWMLRSKLAPGVRCVLEHGGCAPVLVTGDADLELAVAAITTGAYYHAGQVCVSTQRIFVDVQVVEEFSLRLTRSCDALKYGNPLHADTQLGPMIAAAAVSRVESWVREAIAGGARCLAGGERIGHSSYACTLLAEPPVDARISCEEIFGPVAAIYSYEKLSTAIDLANSLRYAFQAAVFTGDIDRALHAFSGLDASAVMVNDHTAFRVDGMPFAGLRESGLGTGGVRYSMSEMQVHKMLIVRSGEIA